MVALILQVHKVPHQEGLAGSLEIILLLLVTLSFSKAVPGQVIDLSETFASVPECKLQGP